MVEVPAEVLADADGSLGVGHEGDAQLGRDRLQPRYCADRVADRRPNTGRDGQVDLRARIVLDRPCDGSDARYGGALFGPRQSAQRTFRPASSSDSVGSVAAADKTDAQ